jgi:hypothetical protein
MQIYNTWSIDSLKIRIPLRKVNILDESINEMIARVSLSSGEVIETFENTKSSRDDKGIKTTFSIEQRATKFDTIPYLIILINAKQLGSQYFEGINTDNFIALYEYLMALRVVYFHPQALLDSECTDIDFKRDITATDSQVKKALDTMNQHCTASKDYDKGSKMFWKKDNKGLQFNKRNTTSFAKAPFLKIYSKTLDLKGKSNIFAMAYLDEIPEDLWRIEFTIKNKKHLATFEIGNTFCELGKLSQDEIEQMYQTTLRAVLEKRIRLPMHQDTIPPQHIILVNGLIWLLDEGHQWGIIKTNLLGSLTSANRTKKGQLLQQLFDSYISPIKGYSKHLEVDSLLNQIGYTF